MTDLVTIGEFSVMTQLSVKTLRHYHDVGLLEPTTVVASSGYRFYGTDLVPTAQLIRRLRGLEMPVPDVRSVLAAPDERERDALIGHHLARMEGALQQTRAAVSDLRVMLGPFTGAIDVEYRDLSHTTAIGVTGQVAVGDVLPWWQEAAQELRALARQTEVRVTGFLGGLYDPALYTEEIGQVTVFLPVAEPLDSGRVKALTIPAAQLAVTVHRGSYAGIDRTYGALGTYVAGRGESVPGPIRENYLLTPDDTIDENQLRTEIGWPVSFSPSFRGDI
ncbi:MerR family transcriptional regulator [Rhodococcus fascians]|nr:MerR family transcriptional regulator [Rhodococcus fascians]MBY4433102.1 MerR family transcriptional regulator [Rhodococcus fascians]